MVLFLLFILVISVILIFSVIVHLSISPSSNHKRLVKHRHHLHDVIFSHQEEDDDYGPFLSGAGAL